MQQRHNLDFGPQDVNIINPKQAKKAVVATGIGNMMEWFDFGLYAYLAVILSQLFFSNVHNSSLQLVLTFGTFAAAFLVRPIGGIFFGRIGDKYGRKVVLSTTIILMALSTLFIALLPTYEQIGIWAPIFLLVARIVQGFSTGGEYSGAMVYIAESSPDKKRGILGSGLEIGTLSGYIAASGIVTILTVLLTNEQMLSWGWRIPFLIAAPIGLVGLYLRRHLSESPVFQEMEKEKAQEEYKDDKQIPLIYILKYYKKDFLLSIVIVAFFNITNYMILSFIPSYLTQIVKMKETTGLIIISITMTLMIPLAFYFGKLSDKVGNKRVVQFGLLGLTLCSIPAFLLIRHGHIVAIFAGIFVLGFFLSIYEGTLPSLLPSLFFTDVRYRALSISFNISVSIFGGTTPLVSSYLVHITDNALAPAFYLTGVSLIGLIVFSLLFVTTSGRALKGAYPTVETKKEAYEVAKQAPEEALWWHEEALEVKKS
ncbi:MFS transporter [Bacillus cytotoxicus]|uniref:MFS transporter n=1 Tax=Bacillus cytotoxicus TaxID=580165 RepID=UPI0008646A5D|nr:MFS transporter [Bacillus cytotoxicus]AWC28382.1 MFS transporter [Bacillus cytotoxicus]AWC40233.1 MFS transporter [Bacillus cytotoxicus]AWC48164.1 MFS transporter [Bacillus cytotoxicus]AWC52449.1 MFS transporter [Bacillus cytotoxicus]AWC56582.1 MFS transporter [Bacillus cytotoxicus]